MRNGVGARDARAAMPSVRSVGRSVKGCPGRRSATLLSPQCRLAAVKLIVIIASCFLIRQEHTIFEFSDQDDRKRADLLFCGNRPLCRQFKKGRFLRKFAPISVQRVVDQTNSDTIKVLRVHCASDGFSMHLFQQALFDDLERAFTEGNYGRLVALAPWLVDRARACPTYAEAALILAAKLLASHTHRWETMAIARDLAKASHEQSDQQHRASAIVIASITAMIDAGERVRAAHTLLVTAGRCVVLELVAADLILAEVGGLADREEQRLMVRAVLANAPPDPDIEARARQLMRELDPAKARNATMALRADKAELAQFVSRHHRQLQSLVERGEPKDVGA